MIYQFSVLQTLLLQECRNVYYYFSSVVLTNAEIQGAVDEIRAEYVLSTLSNLNGNNWNARGADVRRVDLGGFLGQTFLFSSGVLVGSDASDSYASQIACLVSGKGVTQQPNSVRSYLCGLTEVSMSDNGLISTAYQNVAQTFIESIDVLNAGAQTITRQSVRWDVTNSFVEANNPLSSYSVSNIPATQRRRRIGRGI